MEYSVDDCYVICIQSLGAEPAFFSSHCIYLAKTLKKSATHAFHRYTSFWGSCKINVHYFPTSHNFLQFWAKDGLHVEVLMRETSYKLCICVRSEITWLTGESRNKVTLKSCSAQISSWRCYRSLHEKCPYSEFFRSVFSRIWTK